MAAGAGALVVSLGLDGAEYFAGLNKAELAAKKLEQQSAKLARGIDAEVEALQRSADKMRMSATMATLYELALKGATKAQLESAASALAQVEGYEAIQAATAKVATIAKAAFAVVVAGAVAAAVAFKELVSGAGDFQDLAEVTGGTAEDLASLALAAAGAGVTMDSIAAASVRLTKGLVGVDDESKAAGAALKALGINIEDFKRLDPVAQYEAVGKALAGYADGAGKTAVAVALFGQRGAEQLKVFKQLEEQGGRQVILTQQQIDAADAYSDSQAISTKRLQLYAQALAASALPAVTDFKEALIDLVKELSGADRSSSKLGDSKGVVDFADKAADAMARVIDVARSVAGAFNNVGTYIGVATAQAAALARGDMKLALAIGDEYRADLARNTQATESFYDKLQRSRAARKAADANPASYSHEGRAPTLLPLDFDGPAKKAKTVHTPKDTETEAQHYLEHLQKQGEKVQELTGYEQALSDIQHNRLKGINPGLEAQILAQAKQNDLAKQAKLLRDGEVEVTTRIAKAQLSELDAITKGNDSLVAEIELLGRDAESLAALELQKVRVTRAEKELRLERLAATGVADQQLQVLEAEIEALRVREGLLLEKADKTADVKADKEAAKAGGKDVADSLQSDVSNALSAAFRDSKNPVQAFIDGLANTLYTRVASSLADALATQLVGGSGSGGTGGLLGSLITGFLGIGGGSTDASAQPVPGRPRGGAATGTNSLERDMITLVHKGEAIVPKAYNPAANPSTLRAASSDAAGAQVTNYISVGAGVARGEVANMMQAYGQRLKGEILSSMRNKGAFSRT